MRRKGKKKLTTSVSCSGHKVSVSEQVPVMDCIIRYRSNFLLILVPTNGISWNQTFHVIPKRVLGSRKARHKFRVIQMVYACNEPLRERHYFRFEAQRINGIKACEPLLFLSSFFWFSLRGGRNVKRGGERKRKEKWKRTLAHDPSEMSTTEDCNKHSGWSSPSRSGRMQEAVVKMPHLKHYDIYLVNVRKKGKKNL